MNMKIRLSLVFFIAASLLNSLPAFAGNKTACRVNGSYSYLYNGTDYSLGGSPFTETGFFNIDKKGNLTGEGIIAFQFADFNKKGPVWLLLREVQSNGTVAQDPKNSCSGTVDFVATATVLSSSNPGVVPVDTVLFTNVTRSIAYTTTKNGGAVEMVSTAPGTIASGTAHK